MHDHWLERWREGRLGWHEPGGNASLKRYWRGRGHRVLVPLCGKSVDLRWLAERGHAVTGVELAERGIRAFFEEQGLSYQIRDGAALRYEATDLPIAIYHGDYFALQASDFEAPFDALFDALFDRAALIALPPQLRPRYAAHTDSLLRAGAERLLVTLEYDQAAVEGPPFSVPAAEVLGYWPDLVRVHARDAADEVPPRFREMGLRPVTEAVWRSP
jgi:thiopurine S-methyltransferase